MGFTLQRVQWALTVKERAYAMNTREISSDKEGEEIRGYLCQLEEKPKKWERGDTMKAKVY